MDKKRNFSLHISPEQKDALKTLADGSGMTLTQYVETVLNEAVREQEVYELRPHKVLKSAEPAPARL